MTFEQRAGRSELIDDLFCVQILTSMCISVLQSEFECRLIRI
jgi:hypothetical protein